MRILLIVVAYMMVAATVMAAPFENANKDNSGVGTMLGEAACYGEYEVDSQFIGSLDAAINEALYQSSKFKVISAPIDYELFHKVHKDVIVRGHFYNRGTSNAEVIHYANEVLGKGYRPTDEEVKAKKKMAGTPYSLSPTVAMELKEYAIANGVKYLVFCNLNNVEMWFKNSIFNKPVDAAFRGKNIRTEIDYYLVNTYTGKVYDGHSDEDKTAQQMNLFVADTGVGMTVDAVARAIMDIHVKKIIRKLESDGLKAVGA